MANASQHAEKLAQANGIDLDSLEGTGHKGLITKFDVQNAIDKRADRDQAIQMGSSPVETPRIEAPMSEAAAAAVAAQEATPEKGTGIDTTIDVVSEVSADEQESLELTEDPPQIIVTEDLDPAELVKVILNMQGQIDALQEQQKRLVSREEFDTDLMDEYFFLHKKNGRKWQERRIVEGKTVMVDCSGSAFFGPFEKVEMIDKYLEAKSEKRMDSYIDWQGCAIVQGREARSIDREEKAALEAAFAAEDSSPVNILDRRIWASKQAEYGATPPGEGKLAGQDGQSRQEAAAEQSRRALGQ